jgi:CubicO group peptidase (beta-lactamase class C family)
MIQANEIPGAVTLVADREGISHLQAVGNSGAKAGKPLRPDLCFGSQSMTKPLTGTAIMMLQEMYVP